MTFESDLFDMCDPDEFGDSADFGSGVLITGIYDREPVELATPHGYVQSTSYTFACPTSVLPAWVGDGTPVTVKGISFKVRKPEPDGAGMTEMVLEVQ